MTDLSRRSLIAATAGGALLSSGAYAAGQSVTPERGTEGAPIIGPRNPAREAQDPFTVLPPKTDHGTMPNLKWSFADSHMRLEEGGWA